MRRWLPVLPLVIAAGGLALALALPSRTVPDCPLAGAPPNIKCVYVTDLRPWVPFAVGAAAVLPAVILIGARLRPSRRFASAALIGGVSLAVVLWWMAGPLLTFDGDCPPYPRCYTTGHPYGWPAFLTLLVTAAISFWLWPHETLADERRSRESRQAAG